MKDDKRCVVIGGGTAGISVAARLVKKGFAVTVVDPSEKHYYQPIWTLVGGGIVKKQVSERDEKSVIPRGVKWVKERVERVLPEENAVVTDTGSRLEYDTLVVAPGIKIDWDKIPGLVETLGKNGVSSNYSYETVDKTWEFIRGLKKGKAIFTQPATPIKCGGAPQKICYLAEDHFRRSGVRDDIDVQFISAGGALFTSPYYSPTLEKHAKDKGITTRFKLNLKAIRPEEKEAVFENMATGEEVVEKYDLLHVTPPMSAPSFIKESGLGNEAGWAEVSKETLQHVRYPNVFAIGDASNLPTSKTGAAIRKQVPVLVDNLVSFSKGQPLKAVYDGYTSCPVVTGYDSLVMAEFDYDLKPQESFPFDQRKERYSMYLVKRYLLPQLYWNGMLKGRA